MRIAAARHTIPAPHLQRGAAVSIRRACATAARRAQRYAPRCFAALSRAAPHEATPLTLRCACLLCAAASFVVSEFTVVLLHLLSALHDRLLQRPGSSLVVTMLTRQALRDEVERRLSGSTSSASAPPPASDSKGTSATSQSGRPLLFSASATDSPLRLRWCNSWSDAVRIASPPRVVYLSSLMWLAEECSVEQAERLVTRMLGEIGATLWPPPSWEAMMEHKDKIYSQFNKFMLPARWVALRAVNSDIARLAASLLGFCRTDGDYFIKGSYSYAKLCGQRITVTGGRCPELADVLRRWVENDHQTAVGIQPFVPGFDEFELRTWLVADPVTGRWRPALTIKTQLSEKGAAMSTELFQPLHGKGLRIAQLVDDMLSERAEFFSKLHALGLPALRIDCGYHRGEQRAFFSEFSACDAFMWSEVHGQDLAYVVGRAMGDAIWTRLLEAR